jgi:histidinol-phosphate phosphatase family protein
VKKSKAVFLDRDGTLLTERGYLDDPRKIYFYKGVFAALKKLSSAGYKLIIITNQSGVARGYFTLGTLAKIHARFKKILGRHGLRISGIYFCPHLPTAGCRCRKPKPYLLKKAAREHGIDLRKSFMIGDQQRDMELARRAGARGILVLTGGGRSLTKRQRRSAHTVAGTMMSAARWILKETHAE